MAMPAVTVRWGPNFANTIQLNDKTNYLCRSFDLYGGPDNNLIMADTWFSSPYDVRAKLKERAFSIALQISYEKFSSGYVAAHDTLKQALYSGPVRVVVSRAGRGYQYITARLATIKEDRTGRFILTFTAADPVFSKCDNNGLPIVGTATGNTGAPPYTPVNLPVYSGSSPAEPIVSMTVNSTGNVYAYYQTITITNPSNAAFNYHPVCLTLGDIRSDVGTVFHEIGGGDRRIRDIRLESPGGSRKTIFIRDDDQHGYAWHENVKIWTIIYALAPGESKVLHLIYGCATADPNEVYKEPSGIKPMFSMYSSDNTFWWYTDFMPPWGQPQTRSEQWQAYIPGSDNLTWLGYVHPAFDPPVPGSGNVPAAGGKTLDLNPASGAAGLQLTVPPSIASIQFTYKWGANGKTPFALRSQRPDMRWVDDWAIGTDKAVLAHNTATHVAGNTLIFLDSISRGGSTFAVGDQALLALDSGAYFVSTVSVVNVPANTITLSTGLPSGMTAGSTVQQFIAVSWTTVNYPTGDCPKTVAFILRGDHPELTSGGWYFGGADQVKIFFVPAEQITVRLGARTNLTTAGLFQLRGQFGNSATAEYMKINTQLGLGDKIVVDCIARTCNYYHWNGTSFDAPVPRFEALIFEVVRSSWMHIDPALSTNNMTFTDNADSNFRNLTVNVVYPIRYF